MTSPTALALVAVSHPRELLPLRQGSLILILGGAVVLAVSLVGSLFVSRSRLQRRSEPTPAVGPRPRRDVEPARPPEDAWADHLRWHETLLKTAARAGVGTPQLVTSTPGPHALLLVDCLECRRASSDCAWKRDTLQEALERFAPEGRVEHVSCNPGERRACIFEIQTGDRAS